VNRRTLRATLTFALLVASVSLPVAAHQAVASSNALAPNCITPQLTVAPALTRDPDTNPDGSPVKITPDQRGRYTPIIMVHGWTGTDVHNDARTGNFSHKIDLTTNQLGSVNSERSMIGQLQRIRGAAVFTFDYQQFSARWVDDSHIGPALGAAIDCLYQSTGEKVIVVGHSMGGLAARYAITHPGVGGIDRATEVSTVVTFGTPETGSLIALLANGSANTAAAAGLAANGDLILPLLRLFLAECGTLSTSSLQTGTVCDFLPGPARAFDSNAGRALRYGSAQLAALKPWPKGIVVDALAGQATFQVPQAGWFALPWNTSPVPVGDMIVTVDSALTGASPTKQVPCSYQLNAVRGVTDSVALSVGLVSKNDIAKQPLAAFKSACFHTDLMRDIELTNEATGEINQDIAAREATAFLKILPTTSVTNINPLTSSGALREGWSIAQEGIGDPVDCSYDQGSPSAVSPGTHSCGDSASMSDACWTSSRYPGQILCLLDPFTKVLHARLAVNVPTSTTAASLPQPVGVELYDGTQWRRRIGGTWGGRADGLAGAYSCSRGAICDYAKTGKSIVILTDGGSFVDTSTQPWTVKVGEIGDPQTNYPPPKTVKVRKVLYVSTR
jgi:pimeloyl-ACP methyl ester carboxylesterase